MMNKAFLAVSALALVSCATTSDAAHRPAPVKIGQTAYVGGQSVRPIMLVEDSRCPANARCIWAGRVVVRVDVRKGTRHRQLDLTLGEPQSIGNGSLSLTSVMPVKYTNVALKPHDYRFRFTFARGG